MNYKKIYSTIIENRKNNPYEGYTEKHHIIPRCMNGTDDKENIVSLSAREHYVCHQLLVKMYPKEHGLIKAANMMCTDSFTTIRTKNRVYGWLRERLSIEMSRLQTGNNNSQYGTRWIHNLELKKSKRIKKEDELPSEWFEGRIINFDKLQEKEQEKIDKQSLKDEILRLRTEEYTYYYEIYSSCGWKKFQDVTGYFRSQPNLIRHFIKYVDEYVPQMGKKR